MKKQDYKVEHTGMESRCNSRFPRDAVSETLFDSTAAIVMVSSVSWLLFKLELEL